MPSLFRCPTQRPENIGYLPWIFRTARASPGRSCSSHQAGISKRAIDTLKPVVIDARERNELAPDTYDIATAEGIEALCSIPLVNRGRGLGLLSIFRTTETPFSPEDVDFLSRASGQIAIAVENALAYREISELKDKLAQEKVYLEEEIRSEMGFEQIIGNSVALKHVCNWLKRPLQAIRPFCCSVRLERGKN